MPEHIQITLPALELKQTYLTELASKRGGRSSLEWFECRNSPLRNGATETYHVRLFTKNSRVQSTRVAH